MSPETDVWIQCVPFLELQISFGIPWGECPATIHSEPFRRAALVWRPKKGCPCEGKGSLGRLEISKWKFPIFPDISTNFQRSPTSSQSPKRAYTCLLTSNCLVCGPGRLCHRLAPLLERMTSPTSTYAAIDSCFRFFDPSMSGDETPAATEEESG